VILIARIKEDTEGRDKMIAQLEIPIDTKKKQGDRKPTITIQRRMAAISGIQPDYFYEVSPTTGLPSLYWLVLFLEDEGKSDRCRFVSRATGLPMPMRGQMTFRHYYGDDCGCTASGLSNLTSRWQEMKVLGDPDKFPEPSREFYDTVALWLSQIEWNARHFLRPDEAGKEFVDPIFEQKYKGKGLLAPDSMGGKEFIFHEGSELEPWKQLWLHHYSFLPPMRELRPHLYREPDDALTLRDRVIDWAAPDKLQMAVLNYLIENGANSRSAAAAMIKGRVKSSAKPQMHRAIEQSLESIRVGRKINKEHFDLVWEIFAATLGEGKGGEAADLEAFAEEMGLKLREKNPIVV
jgi:hypothetical protein